MNKKKLTQLLGLNLGIAAVDVIAFSHLELFGPSAFETALDITLIFLSGAGLIYGNYTLFSEPKIQAPVKKAMAADDYIEALNNHRDQKTFEKTIDLLIDQIGRLEKKNKIIRDILLQRFNDAEISYKKFDAVIAEVEKIFFMNIRNILNKLNAFDDDDYNFIRKKYEDGAFSQKFMDEKFRVYDEYISFIKSSAEDNEHILLKLDKLLLEISDLNCVDHNQLDMIIEEIDEFTKQVKYYKN